MQTDGEMSGFGVHGVKSTKKNQYKVKKDKDW